MEKQITDEEQLIPLTKGEVAIIDSKYLGIVNTCKWYFHKRGYAHNRQKGLMHRYIWQSVNGAIPKGLQIDHINQNKLDNRSSNLRIVTNQQNQMNRPSYKNSTSKYKGVSWHKRGKKWCAQIQINGKVQYLGLYNSETEAAKAYDKAAIELFDEYGFFNFPDEK